MSDKIRVLIVDDVATTRENIVKLMQFQPGIEAVGQAQNGEEAIFQAKALRPDVVLIYQHAGDGRDNRHRTIDGRSAGNHDRHHERSR